MIARLWWKEWRTFWPLWVFVLVLAVVAHWLALQSDSPIRHRANLTILALSWAALYAFAVSAAAFAGEREHGTLRWLEILPVDRRALWNGKASFALASTYVLALALAVLAAFGTSDREPTRYEYAAITLGFWALLLETIAWGLFWSSLLRHVLPAATLAIVGVGTIAGFVVDRVFFDFTTLSGNAPVRAGIAAGLLLASWFMVVHQPRGPRVRARRPRIVLSAAPRPIRVPGRLRTLRSLVWQTRREAFWVWVGVVLLAVLVPILCRLWVDQAGEAPFLGFGVLASLVAGVSAFHAATRSRSYRFFVHHGVSPRTVWCVRVALWLVFLMLPASGLLAVFARSLHVVGFVIIAVMFAFFTGLLCGQVFERAITAAVVGFAVLLLLLVPYAVMVEMLLLPEWVVIFPPLILFVVSWAWSRDWMLARSGRWGRLAAGLVVPSLCLFAGQAAYRAWSIPDLGPFPSPASASRLNLPPAEDAARIYRQAFRAALLDPAALPLRERAHRVNPIAPDVQQEIVRVVVRGWDPNAKPVVSWWQESREAVALVRRAAALPGANFGTMRLLDELPPDSAELGHFDMLAALMALDARERESRGDLDGAWQDVRAVLNMARQLGADAYMLRLRTAAVIESQGLHMGLVWASAEGQTRKHLQAALEELSSRPERLPLGESIKVEARIWERTLALPMDELRPIFAPVAKPNGMGRAAFALASWVLANPWERERARRVGRLFYTDALENADRDPWQRGKEAFSRLSVSTHGRSREFSPGEIAYAVASTPLLRFFSSPVESMVQPVDRNVVDRRALLVMLGIRSWQLAHDGQAPERLEQLVPADLATLPIDPFSGQSFLYTRSGDQGVPPLGWSATNLFSGTNDRLERMTPGRWLLYSVGWDRVDHHGHSLGRWALYGGDIVYSVPGPISEVPNEPDPTPAAPSPAPSRP